MRFIDINEYLKVQLIFDKWHKVVVKYYIYKNTNEFSDGLKL